MAMSESRVVQLLAGQSSTARKVFPHVPIQESWSAHDIQIAALAANATSVAVHAVRRALNEMKDAGIIREPTGGKFQRDAYSRQTVKEIAMPVAAKETIGAIKKPEIQALDALASLSAEVVALSDDISSRMKRLAGRIEEVALSVEVEREGNAEALGKLKQLQSLLKSL